ncbi:hypothetical protein L596_007713 [Steinernema carpocapsae]|uniref:Uncharacterized protein n=1 Tax=Steinernema carpocapsae TaxID=34508 RepID=A0A4U5PA72_STECR|nr:hypothetical protein L596_007713 [Steinernema carpocapsae]
MDREYEGTRDDDGVITTKRKEEDALAVSRNGIRWWNGGLAEEVLPGGGYLSGTTKGRFRYTTHRGREEEKMTKRRGGRIRSVLGKDMSRDGTLTPNRNKRRSLGREKRNKTSAATSVHVLGGRNKRKQEKDIYTDCSAVSEEEGFPFFLSTFVELDFFGGSDLGGTTESAAKADAGKICDSGGITEERRQILILQQRTHAAQRTTKTATNWSPMRSVVTEICRKRNTLGEKRPSQHTVEHYGSRESHAEKTVVEQKGEDKEREGRPRLATPPRPAAQLLVKAPELVAVGSHHGIFLLVLPEVLRLWKQENEVD